MCSLSQSEANHRLHDIRYTAFWAYRQMVKEFIEHYVSELNHPSNKLSVKECLEFFWAKPMVPSLDGINYAISFVHHFFEEGPKKISVIKGLQLLKE